MPVVVPASSDYVFPNYRSDDVLTQRNDNNRTGASHVAGINQHTVTPGRFKRLGAFPVNGVVLSQPLYVHRAMVNNVVQPVLVVATSNNDVYAFSPFENRPQWLWHRWLGRPVVSRTEDPPLPAEGADCAPNALAAWQEPKTLAPKLENGLIGIESTPVIDLSLGRIFVSYKTFDGLQHLAALSLNDGSVVRSVVVPAPNPQWHRLHRNRASLLLMDGMVFVGFASLCEGNEARMHGSISAFDAATLEPVGRYQVTDDATDGGGVWQGSTGLAADTRGNLYFTTGNRRLCGGPKGESDTPDKPNLASSVVRVKTERRNGQGLPPQPGEPYRVLIEAQDYFTPYRRIMEDCFDLDLSAAGVLLIPGTRYLGTGGKQGVFYVLDRADMGQFDNPGAPWNLANVRNQSNTKHKDTQDEPARDRVHQKFQATVVRHSPGGNCPDVDPKKPGKVCVGSDYVLEKWMEWPHIHGTPAFARFGLGEFMFVWGEKDKPKRFRWRNGKFEWPPLEGEPIAPPYINDRENGMPGGMLSVNIDHSGSALGVVFASVRTCDETGYPSCRTPFVGQNTGILRAYDPFTMQQIWNDAKEPDKYWFAKLVPPTIANGRVFLATASGKVLIYGAVDDSQLAPQIQIPGDVNFGNTCVGPATTAVLNVCNTGSANLVVNDIASSDPLFAVTSPSAGFTVTIGPDSCFPFQVTFNPASPGPKTATLTVSSNDSTTPTLPVAVKASVGQPTAVTIIADTGNFGELCVNPTKFRDLPLTINNSGSCPLTVTAIATSSADFQLPQVLNFPLSVAPGDTLTVPGRFQPTSPGAKSANVTITTNDPASPAKVIAVSGTAPPSYVCQPPLFASIDAAVGPTWGSSGGGNYTFNSSGRVMAPFGPNHTFGVQAQGEYLFYPGRQEGQLDTALLYRRALLQFTAGGSFKAANLRDELSAGAISHATLALDVLLPNVRFGIFGSKGLKETDVVSLSESFGVPAMSGQLIVATEQLLHTNDQLGGVVQFEVVPNTWIDGHAEWLHRHAPGIGDTAGGAARLSALIFSNVALTAQFDVNESFVNPLHTTGTFTIGVTLGRWSRPTDYSNPLTPLGTFVPRVHYERFGRVR